MPMLALAGFKRVLSVIMYQDFMTPLTNMVLVIEIMSKINARPLKPVNIPYTIEICRLIRGHVRFFENTLIEIWRV